jgi:hypothetical protein
VRLRRIAVGVPVSTHALTIVQLIGIESLITVSSVELKEHKATVQATQAMELLIGFKGVDGHYSPSVNCG